MEADHRPHARRGPAVGSHHGIQRLAQPIPAGIERMEALIVEHLSEPRETGRHREHVVVEGASMGKRTRLRWIEVRHEIRTTAEGPEGQASPEVFAQGDQVGLYAEQRRGTLRRQS